MWELIRANKRRSAVLVLAMLALLLALGFVIGSALAPSLAAGEFYDDYYVPSFTFDPTAGFIGMAIAFALWMCQASVAYFQGDSILLAVSRARPIQRSDHPQLYNVVEEMTIAASLPKMPKIYLIDDMALNAFATGRKPENAAVAVTAGLLGKLNRDELQGVVAHEISHIVNRDVMFMTMVGIMVGSIVMISEVFLRSLRFSGSSGRYRGDKKGGGGQLILIVIAIVFAILAPIFAQLIYFAVSRKREYLADAGSAVFTRYPEGLASALEVISTDTEILQSANRATAPMYIVNPLQQAGSMALGLTRSHPPVEDRIRVLRGIAGGVSYAKYQDALRRTGAHHAATLPRSALRQGVVPIREAHPDAVAPIATTAQRMRQAGDLLRKVNEFVFLSCACGMRIKLPPDFKAEEVECPRCQRHVAVPVAQVAAAAAVANVLHETAGTAGTEKMGRTAVGGTGAVPFAKVKADAPLVAPPPLRVQRPAPGWSSVRCACGGVLTLPPEPELKEANCPRCGARIQISRAE
ncbi:MAG: M48 family metallopeptidase [Candidatus Hydrogenedentes bacterium]|nr:M48 family metallopeptidase [Candidatus Hydrogenedentota bacterium]MBI3117131.1 M48 family metallopeptidase [Candidatus Hydrogenedentota bacterium]